MQLAPKGAFSTKNRNGVLCMSFTFSISLGLLSIATADHYKEPQIVLFFFKSKSKNFFLFKLLPVVVRIIDTT